MNIGLADILIKEKILSKKTLCDLSLLHINQLNQTQYMNLCAKMLSPAKTSIFYKSSFKQMILTEEEKIMFKDMMEKICFLLGKKGMMYKCIDNIENFLLKHKINKLSDLPDTSIFNILLTCDLIELELTYNDLFWKSASPILHGIYYEKRNINTNINKNLLICQPNSLEKLLKTNKYDEIISILEKCKSVKIYPNHIKMLAQSKMSREKVILIIKKILLLDWIPDLETFLIMRNGDLLNYIDIDTYILMGDIIDHKTIDMIELKKIINDNILFFKENIDLRDFAHLCDKYKEDDIIKYIIKIKQKICNIPPDKQIRLPIIATQLKMTNVIQTLIDFGIDLSELCMQTACLLFMERFTEIHFDKDNIIKLINYLYNHKLFVKTEYFKEYLDAIPTDAFLNEDLQIFITYGLVMNKECISMILNRQFIINDIKLYGFDYDDTLFEICLYSNFFPPEYIEKFIDTIGMNKILLRNLFMFDELDKIKKHVEKINIEPDLMCFKCGLLNPQYKKILEYYKYIPSINDIIHITDNNLRKDIYNNYHK
jgi:hypothetical protein